MTCKVSIGPLPDRQPIPSVHDVLEGLGGNRWFTTLDFIEKAYHQGFVEASSWPLTAFVTPWGLFEWNHMPFWAHERAVVFQRGMEACLEGMIGDIAWCI